MAYSVDDIDLVESWTASGYELDDIALDIDVTSCMTNGTPSEECDEWKEGTINVRMEVGVPPSAVTALLVRFYLTSIMTAGPNALLPYIDIDSVSITNEIIQDYSSAGQWYVHTTDASFRAELADLGSKFAMRLSANTEVAKSKLGEVEIDITYVMEVLSGITKDKDGVALGSCECALFKIETDGPPSTFSYQDAVISHATTGAYSFDCWDFTYMVTAHKDGSPNVMDVTDKDLAVD